jgi:hypothetical protein
MSPLPRPRVGHAVGRGDESPLPVVHVSKQRSMRSSNPPSPRGAADVGSSHRRGTGGGGHEQLTSPSPVFGLTPGDVTAEMVAKRCKNTRSGDCGGPRVSRWSVLDGHVDYSVLAFGSHRDLVARYVRIRDDRYRCLIEAGAGERDGCGDIGCLWESADGVPGCAFKNDAGSGGMRRLGAVG